MEEPMVEEKTWEEFRESGMLWFANTFLHTFGWAVALDFDDGKVVRAYPARVRYRGFDGDTNDLGYYKVSKFFKENADQLLAECEQPEESVTSKECL